MLDCWEVSEFFNKYFTELKWIEHLLHTRLGTECSGGEEKMYSIVLSLKGFILAMRDRVHKTVIK